ncbi:MAG: FGGY-family carbohydrate kinase [Treponema sp.]|nr:FGGY-family carbohydrate kinase [Treponema sp.]
MLFTIDIGTSSFKSAVWSHEGKRVSFYSVPLSIDINDGSRQESKPQQWLGAFEESCKKHKNLKSVEAIVISGNGPSLVPVTGEPSPAGKLTVPAENARLWLDKRAVKYQKEVSHIMGGFVDAKFFLPKIMYIKNEEPDIYNQTKYFLGCPEYLAYVLTGKAKTVFPCEGFDRWFWDSTVLEKLKLDFKKFPSFIKPGDFFGTLISAIAEQFGFTKNIPVISGGPDFYAAILGSGVTEPGQACNRTGTSDGINLCTKNFVNADELMSYRHPINEFWNLSGIIDSTGKSIEKGINQLGLSSYNDFFELAESGKAGLKNSNFANSILEEIGFKIKDVLLKMENAGEKAVQLRVTGGLSGNSFLNQLKADITGINILTGEYKEAELQGLAIIGSCTLGKYASYSEASGVFVSNKVIFKPNNRNTALYNQLYNEYKK